MSTLCCGFVLNVLPLIEKNIPEITVYVVGELGAPSLSTVKKRILISW